MQTVLAKAVISSPSKVTLSAMIAENPYASLNAQRMYIILFGSQLWTKSN